MKSNKYILCYGDVLDFYGLWNTPKLILSDGPYGLGLFPGEPKSPKLLAEWYKPHIEAWTRNADSTTTLWLWNTEQGWASIHNLLLEYGWIYQETTIWDKGIGHIAGKVNSKTIRSLPVVTEIAVRYIRPSTIDINGKNIHIREWIRNEWMRSGLPLSRANDACGVKNAATRKYLTKDGEWYFPPDDMIKKMSDYCNQYGKPSELPYFDMTGINMKNGKGLDKIRNVWNHKHGLTNVWSYPPLRGTERIKRGQASFHANQKPLVLIKQQIELATNPADVVWEPFGGTGTATVASLQAGRLPYVCEINNDYFEIIKKRIDIHM